MTFLDLHFGNLQSRITAPHLLVSPNATWSIKATYSRPSVRLVRLELFDASQIPQFAPVKLQRRFLFRHPAHLPSVKSRSQLVRSGDRNNHYTDKIMLKTQSKMQNADLAIQVVYHQPHLPSQPRNPLFIPGRRNGGELVFRGNAAEHQVQCRKYLT